MFLEIIQILSGVLIAMVFDNLISNEWISIFVVCLVLFVIQMLTSNAFWFCIGSILYYYFSGWFSCATCEKANKY